MFLTNALKRLLLGSLCASLWIHSARAQDGDAPVAEVKAPSAASETADDADRETRLAEYLSGCKFVGKFTVDGKEGVLPKTEEYTISKCEKLPAKDMYRMTARIKYGSVDQEVPLEIKILWAGETPVITLDSMWIPGMGTFDARVMIRRGRYAGSWQHDENGGHLFGKIVKD